MRDKVMALLEEVEKAAEIIDTNTTDWESRKLDRGEGAFSTDEITDPGNIDRNRINHELPMDVSDHSENLNPEHKIVAGMGSIMIGVSESDSKFAQEVAKVLTEQNWEGVKAWNQDLRISANQVKRALDAVCPGVLGIQVEEELVGDRGEGIAFKVAGGVDWEQYDKDHQLPKKLDVENVQLELDDSDENKLIYRVVGTNSAFPIPTDDAL